MTDWDIALHQIHGEEVQRIQSCLECGKPIKVTKTHPYKEYCDDKCSRRARYFRGKVK